MDINHRLKKISTPEFRAAQAVADYVLSKIAAMPTSVDSTWYEKNVDSIKEAMEHINYGNWFAEKEGLGKNYFDAERQLFDMGYYDSNDARVIGSSRLTLDSIAVYSEGPVDKSNPDQKFTFVANFSDK